MTQSRTLYVGIDISKNTNYVHFMDDRGDTIPHPSKVANDQAGLDKLLRAIFTAADSLGTRNIKVGMEATGLYWWHLQQALAEADSTIEVFVINPALVKGFKKAYPTLPKTDSVDAWVVADRVRFGRLKPVQPSDLRYQAIMRLTRLRYTMVRNITADKNRLCQLMYLKFSTYSDVAVGSRMFAKGPSSLAEHFSPDEIVNKPLDELLGFFMDHSNNRFADPSQFLQELKRAAGRAYRLNPQMSDSVELALTMTYENIRFMQTQCSKLDKVIARQLKGVPQTLETIPGIGPVIAAGILAEVGDVRKFANQQSLAKYAGLTWHKHQSGRFDAEETSLTKAGNRRLRYYLVEGANSLRVHNSEYRHFYQKKYAEVPKHQHKRALVLTARKFVRLVYALLSKGQIYRIERN